MELYILNHEFLPIELVERYHTVIWDERFNEPGELELVTEWTASNKAKLRIGTYLGNNLTPKVMVITKVEPTIGEEGERVLTVGGEGLERIFSRRVARRHFLMLEDDELWEFKDEKPAEIMRDIFTEICVEGVLSPKDVIPYLSIWGMNDAKPYPQGNIPEPQKNVTFEFEPQLMSDIYRTIVEAHPELGYRLYRNMHVDKHLYFDIYTGTDRTLAQTTHTPIIFSLPWGTLDSTSEFDSIEEYYNVAYVFSKYGTAKVNDDYEGFDRQVLVVHVSDQESDNLRGTALTNYLTQKGEEALAEAKRIALFDGEIPKHIDYRYMQDYFLGDEVDLVGDDGMGAKMRIIGNAFVDDQEGFRSYPTFEMIDHISPDTWSGLRGGEVWYTMPGTWKDY